MGPGFDRAATSPAAIQGEFMGVQPSGEQILVKYIDQWRFEDGQAQESWVSLDLLGLMQQIGAIGS